MRKILSMLGSFLWKAQGSSLPRCTLAIVICFFVQFALVMCCAAAELKQKTIEAFEHYVRVCDARMEADLRVSGHFLWLDSLPEPGRDQLYDQLRSGQLEIREERTQEGKAIKVPGGLIHDWVGVVFVPGASIQQAVSFLQDYDNHCRTYQPGVRRSKMLDHTDDNFEIYLQFYKESPRRVSFNTVFEVHYSQIDATHVISSAISTRVAELQNPEQPDSPELAVGQGHGYIWRLNNYWRVEERDGGVYTEVETIALSRDVPAIFAWFVNPLIRRVSQESLAMLLSATRQGLLAKPKELGPGDIPPARRSAPASPCD